MKMIKYRIKEVIDGNGKSYFYPQIKIWFWWTTLKKPSYDDDVNLFPIPFKESKLSKAKEVIDRDYNERMSRVVKQIKYRDYTPINIELNNIIDKLS